MADFSRHQPPAHFFHLPSCDPIAPKRRDGLTFGRKWNSEVLARLEAKQLLAEAVMSHRGARGRVTVWPRPDGSLECICGNIWQISALDPLNQRCPMIVGHEALCWDAGCTGSEISAVWEGFRGA